MSTPFILCLVAVASAVLGLGTTVFALLSAMDSLLLVAPVFGFISAISGTVAAVLSTTRDNQLAF